MADIVIACVDTQIVPQPVDGVLVRIFNQAGDTLITQGTTGAVVPGSGEVELVVPGGMTYRAKMSMSTPGYEITTPQFLEVPDDNPYAFDMTVELFQNPAATDPNLCRASGYIRRVNGWPAGGSVIIFAPIAEPVIVDEVLVLGEKVHAVADEDGYVVVDLYRQGKYRVFVEGLEDMFAEVEVPDRSWTVIGDLLIPIPASATFDPASLSLSPGDQELVDVTITLRSGLEKTIGEVYEELCIQPTEVDGLRLALSSDGLRVTAETVGSYDVELEVTDQGTVLPTPEISGTLPVTVT